MVPDGGKFYYLPVFPFFYEPETQAKLPNVVKTATQASETAKSSTDVSAAG